MSQGGFGDEVRNIKIPRLPTRRIGLIIGAIVLAGLLMSSYYTVGPEENGIVMRFGKFVRTTQPGLHFKWPAPIDGVVLERHEQGEMLAFDLGTDGNLQPILYCDHDGFIQMEGREVFKRAVRAVAQSVKNVLDKAGLTPDDVDVVLPHQANIRIIEAVCQRIGIPMEKTHNVIETTGNTSAASIPLTMAKADADGALEPGKIVLMSGFGAGMAWGSVVVRW